MKLSEPFLSLSNPNNYKYYVYSLVDTRNNSVFYVGKGQRNRMYQHRAQAIKGVCSKKCFRIKELLNSGFGLSEVKIKGFNDEQEAYDYETDLIEYYGLNYLTNILPGGQKAFERRKVLRNERKSKRPQEPVWSVIINRMSVIRDWAVQTGNGMFKVEPVLVADGKMPNFQNAVSSMASKVYNDVIPTILHQAIQDAENGYKVVEALKKYGIHSICGEPLNGRA